MSDYQFDLDKIAHLARIQLRAEDRVHYQQEIEKILELVDQLQAVDTTDVEPLAHPQDAIQRLRDDIADPAIDNTALQAIAPKVGSGLYLSPKVIE